MQTFYEFTTLIVFLLDTFILFKSFEDPNTTPQSLIISSLISICLIITALLLIISAIPLTTFIVSVFTFYYFMCFVDSNRNFHMDYGEEYQFGFECFYGSRIFIEVLSITYGLCFLFK